MQKLLKCGVHAVSMDVCIVSMPHFTNSDAIASVFAVSQYAGRFVDVYETLNQVQGDN